MKHRVIFSLSILMIMMLLPACKSKKQEQLQDLVVEEQSADVQNSVLDYFIVDVPISGPQPLLDSVLAFVNKEVYDACEFFTFNTHYSKKEMFINDGEKIFDHYMEKYTPLMKDSLDSYCDEYGFCLKMETQTKSFVTFHSEFYYHRPHYNGYQNYYTFNKYNGHLLHEIICYKNLVRFFEKYPKYMKDIYISGDIISEQEYSILNFGLLDNYFSIIYSEDAQNVCIINIPYMEIFPYLSSETRRLIPKCLLNNSSESNLRTEL